MEIATSRQGAATILTVDGRVDTVTSGDLDAAISREIDSGHHRLLLDFTRVTYISSGGLRVLLATAKKLDDIDDRYALCGLSPEVHKIMRLAGFTSILSIYSSKNEALASWDEAAGN